MKGTRFDTRHNFQQRRFEAPPEAAIIYENIQLTYSISVCKILEQGRSSCPSMLLEFDISKHPFSEGPSQASVEKEHLL